ncbi:MAG: gamma-glutamylcyclotransferase [Butyricicoccus pullicaecorum]|nr:gamma-glutamylcyclotransferase [Butyricicoccus pullicaecorum]
MNRKPTLYIAYGSNLNLPQMAHRCPTAEVVGASQLQDYELLFRGSRRSAVATVEPKEGSTVPVLLWRIQERDEVSLDLYEGYPRLYNKQMMDVELDGKTVSAMAYIMTPGHEFGIPSDYYVDTIWQGYVSAGFDTQILEDAVEKAINLARHQEQQETMGQTSLFGMDGIK